MSCGGHHAAALSSTGRLYTWGDNRAGQLGLGDDSARCLPCYVEALQLRRVSQVVAGARSTMALTDYNELLAWGCTSALTLPGSSVQVAGHKDATHVRALLPVEVPFQMVPGRTIRRLMASSSHTLSVGGVQFAQQPVVDGEWKKVSEVFPLFVRPP